MYLNPNPKAAARAAAADGDTAADSKEPSHVHTDGGVESPSTPSATVAPLEQEAAVSQVTASP